MCLLWGPDLWLQPFWQMSTVLDPSKTWISNWEPAHWWRMLVSGAETALCLLALAVTSLPLCLGWTDGPICSWLALFWYLRYLLLCEWARLHLRLELSPESFFFFFLLFLAIPQCGLLSHVSSLRLSSGHSGPVLTLSTDYAAHVPLFSPCSLVVDGSLCWQLQLGTCSVGFFSSRLCCPLRFQNSPQALL